MKGNGPEKAIWRHKLSRKITLPNLGGSSTQLHRRASGGNYEQIGSEQIFFGKAPQSVTYPYHPGLRIGE
jgi:hypothetical protein